MRELWFPPDQPPADFAPSLEVAGVLCEHDGRYLFLRRGAQIPNPLTWNIPGGKLEPGESSREAAVRELQEEAGFLLTDIDPLGAVYVRHHRDFIFHLFHTSLPSMPALILDPIECHSSCWVTLAEAERLPLIHGDKETIRFVRSVLEPDSLSEAFPTAESSERSQI